MLHARAQDTFQRGMDLGEQAAQPVGQAGGLGGQVVVEVARAQRVGHRPGCVHDDERVVRVGRGLAGIEIGDLPHRQARQIDDMAAKVAGDGQWQGSHGGDLVDDDQDGSLLGLQLGEDLAEAGLAAGQALVEGLLAGGGQCGGMVFALADVRAEADVDAVGIDHLGHPSVLLARPCHGTDRHIHITKSLPACEKGRWSCPWSAVGQCPRSR